MRKIVFIFLLSTALYASAPFGGIGIAMYKSNRGVSIAGIANGSPASKIGLQLGDCIIAVNGVEIAKKSVSEVKYMIRDDAGKPLTLTIVREGNTFDVNLTRVKMEVIDLKKQGNDTNASSENYKLLDIVSIKDKKTGFYVEQASNLFDNQMSKEPFFGDVKLCHFTRKSFDIYVSVPGKFTIKVLTVNGALVRQKEIDAQNLGLQSIQWNNTLLAAGNYTIVLMQGLRSASYQKNLK